MTMSTAFFTNRHLLVLSILVAIPAFRPRVTSQAGVRVAQFYDSDRPITDPRGDRLGFSRDVDVISEFLRNPRTMPPLDASRTFPWPSGC